MKYFRINNELDAMLGANRELTREDAQARLFRYWINTEHAYTTANIDEDGQGYQKFGVQALGQLSKNDIVFIYENKRGILAVGHVQEDWDKQHYHCSDHKIYQDSDNTFEVYKIKVRWRLCFNDNPIHPQKLRDYGITYFRKTVYEIPYEIACRIIKSRDEEKLFEEGFEKSAQEARRVARTTRNEHLKNAPKKTGNALCHNSFIRAQSIRSRRSPRTSQRLLRKHKMPQPRPLSPNQR